MPASVVDRLRNSILNTKMFLESGILRDGCNYSSLGPCHVLITVVIT